MNTLEWKSQDVQKNVSFETPLYRFGLKIKTILLYKRLERTRMIMLNNCTVHSKKLQNE